MALEGTLHSINVSGGGVPKTPRGSAEVRASGVVGDRQADLRHHGGRERAVSVYSLDRILALQREGHPIVPGSIGENLTLAGLDWTRLGPGARLEIGEVLLEVTRAAEPCQKIAASFRDGEFTRVSNRRHAGWSRFYTRVLREGVLTAGDAVVVVPAPQGMAGA